MKRQSLLLILCLSCQPAFSQSKVEMITRIKARFQAINSNKALNKVVLDNEDLGLDGNPDRGAQLTGYFDGKKLVKIVEWIGVSDKNYISEYYFENDQLAFVYQVTQSFEYDEKKDELDYSKPVTSGEGRYYFNAGRLIDSHESGSNPNHPTGYNAQKELLADALKYQALLRSKRK